ncbi:MAG: lysylphosphatidylglycerol synthase domain-containing protein [Pseudomonadota bacterium]
MKRWAILLALIGLALVTALVIREGIGDVAGILRQAGWALLLLVPLRTLPLACDTMAWRGLLKPIDPQRRASWPFLFWVCAVRESVGLLPMTNIAGDVVGIRLARTRIANGTAVVASVISEVFMTICNQYLFAALGICLLILTTGALEQTRTMLLGLIIALPIPILFGLTLRFGSMFRRIETFLMKTIGPELSTWVNGESLDAEMRAIFNRTWRLLRAMGWQLSGYALGTLETWLALKLLGHPVDFSTALALEATVMFIRHIIVIVPAGLGLQEAGLMMIGTVLGLPPDVSLSLSLAKRLREVVFCTPVLLSWQWFEVQQLREKSAEAT